MTSGEDPLRAGLEAESQLSEGLRLCHAVVSNYRAMLADGAPQDIPANDQAPANGQSAEDPPSLRP